MFFKIKNYSFYCDSNSNRSGFYHECRMSLEGDYRDIARSKIQYYNRTRECYTFQSVLRVCVNNRIDYLIDKSIDNYKQVNGIKRLTKQKKDQLLEEIKKTQELKDLYEVAEIIESYEKMRSLGY